MRDDGAGNVIVYQQYAKLHNISWQTYEDLLQSCRGEHTRLTFDRGVLEIMSVSPEHEWVKKTLGGFFEALTEELGIPRYSLGNTTWRREEVERGLEGDHCYYVRPVMPLHNPAEVDLSVDPPPDLIIEIEISRSAMSRMAIFADLKIPEVWRSDGRQLRFFVLQAGSYVQVERSPTVPWVTAEEIMIFIRRRGKIDDAQLMMEFRKWVRESVLPRKTQAAHDQP